MTKVIDRLARREGRGFMTALAAKPGFGRLRELPSAYSHVQGFRSHDGWPTQAWFWLEWGCSGVPDDGPADKLDCLHALGLTRFHQSGQSHFVTFCCYHRRTWGTRPPHGVRGVVELSQPALALFASVG
jgi:hypothetical protein